MHAEGYTTLSQCTSHRRHSTSSCGRRGSSRTSATTRRMPELWGRRTPAARLDNRPRKCLLGSASKTICDVQDVHLREREVVGLAAVGVLVGAEPERLHGCHAELAG